MKRRIKFIIYISVFIVLLSACGHKDEKQLDTEQLVVGAGVTFESEGVTTLAPEHYDMELSAADLEGMTESVVRIVKNASIYAKPSTEASIVGSIDARTNIGVYGLTEDEAWMVVSFNGRVGYVTADAFEREVVQTQTVIVPTQPANSNQRPSGGNQNTNTGSSERPDGGSTDNSTSTSPTTPPSTQKPSTDSSENTNTNNPSNENENLPSGGNEDEGTSDVPSGGDEGTTDTPSDGNEDVESTEPPTEDEGDDSEDTGSDGSDLPSDGEDSSEGEEPPQESTETPEIPDGIDEVSEGTE